MLLMPLNALEGQHAGILYNGNYGKYPLLHKKGTFANAFACREGLVGSFIVYCLLALFDDPLQCQRPL